MRSRRRDYKMKGGIEMPGQKKRNHHKVVKPDLKAEELQRRQSELSLMFTFSETDGNDNDDENLNISLDFKGNKKK